MTDFQGIAMLISAFATLIGGIGSLILQIIVILGQRRAALHLSDVHNLVNSQSEKLNAAIRLGALAEGKAIGIASVEKPIS